MDLSWIVVPVTAILSGAINAALLYLWEPWAKALAAETGKLDARERKLDAILAETKAVTAAQKEIESSLTTDVWSRQNLWNHKRDTYARLFEVRQKLSDTVIALRTYISRRDGTAEKLHGEIENTINQYLLTFNAAHSELMHATALALIFTSKECCDLLGLYERERGKAGFTVSQEWIDSEFKALSILMGNLSPVAKRDLGIIAT